MTIPRNYKITDLNLTQFPKYSDSKGKNIRSLPLLSISHHFFKGFEAPNVTHDSKSLILGKAK